METPDSGQERICPSCKKEIQKAGKFCGYCGAKLETAVRRPSKTISAPKTSPSRPPNKKVILIPAVILAAIVLGYVIYNSVAGAALNNIRFPSDLSEAAVYNHALRQYERIIEKYPLSSARKEAISLASRLTREREDYLRMVIRRAEEQKAAEEKRQEARRLASTTHQNLYEVYDTYRDTKDPYLNLRSQPSPGARIIKKMKDGTRVKVLQTGLGPQQKWYRIRIEGTSTNGYAHSRYLRKL